MLPTIDLSLIGILLIIWNVIKTIWGYVWGAIVWVKDQAVTLVIGSNFWATIAFFVATGIVLGLVSYVVVEVVSYISDMVIGVIPVQAVRDGLRLICTIIPLKPIARMVSFWYTGIFGMFALKNYAMWYIHIVGWLQGVKSAWKN